MSARGFVRAVFARKLEIVGLLCVRKINKDDKRSPFVIDYILSFSVFCEKAPSLIFTEHHIFPAFVSPLET